MTLTQGGNLAIAGTFSSAGYNKSNWDTAHGWGNHASAGYLTSIGYSVSQSATANSLVQRQANGYILGNYINMSDDGDPNGGNAVTEIITKKGDDYYRGSSASKIRTFLNVADGANNVTNNNQLTNGAGYITSGDGYNANLLDGFDSTNFLRNDGWDTNPGQNANTQSSMKVDFTYSNNAPHTGPLIRLGQSSYDLQLNSTYNSLSLIHI